MEPELIGRLLRLRGARPGLCPLQRPQQGGSEGLEAGVRERLQLLAGARVGAVVLGLDDDLPPLRGEGEDDTGCFPGLFPTPGLFISTHLTRPEVIPTSASRTVLSALAGVVNVTGSCAQSGWSTAAPLPIPGVRMAGVYFPANGKFYAMGGRASDTAGNEFTHPFEYDPNTNAWTTKGATYPDNMVNNIACGVLTDAGTPYRIVRAARSSPPPR